MGLQPRRTPFDSSELVQLIQVLVDLGTQLGDAKEKLGSTAGKLDVFIAQMRIQDERTAALDTRLRKVEGRMHWWSGIAAAAGMAVGLIGSKLRELGLLN